MTDSEVRITSACPHDCPDTCSIVTTVQEGKAIEVRGNPDHPVTQGFLCAKVNRYHERTYHPDRILYPLRRVGAKGEGRFERVSWDEALEGIAGDLHRVAKSSGPQSILPYSYAGTMGMLQRESMSARFFHRLGASLLDRTICASAGSAGWQMVYGDLAGPGPDELAAAGYAENGMIILWGTNPLTSNSHLWPVVRRAREAGTTVVCIDPLRTKTADASDQHIALRPGTDAALAFGLMRVILDEGLVAEDFLAQHAIGWDELRNSLQQNWTLERSAQICGVEMDVIADLAVRYATATPSLIRLNYGMQRHAGGASAMRIASMLPAITGAWRQPGGGALLSTSGAFDVNKETLTRASWIPADTRTINMTRLGDALNQPDAGVGGPPVKAMVVYNSNPVIIAPDSSAVRQGMARDDLVTIVLEQFPTNTVAYADWVLPATTQLEHWDLHTAYGHHFVTLNRPAIDPLGEAVSNTEAFRRLAHAMGFDEPEFDTDDRALIDEAIEAIRGGRVDRDALFGQGWARVQPMRERVSFDRPLSTASGRIELVGEHAGVDRIPDYVPPAEAADANRAERYPLTLLSPPEHTLLNSSFANLPRQGKAAGDQTVWLHPEDAGARQIADGDLVSIGNDRGSFTARAIVTDRTRVGTICATGLRWAQAGDPRTVNDVTSQALTDAGRGATFYDTAVEVTRTESAA